MKSQRRRVICVSRIAFVWLERAAERTLGAIKKGDGRYLRFLNRRFMTLSISGKKGAVLSHGLRRIVGAKRPQQRYCLFLVRNLL